MLFRSKTAHTDADLVVFYTNLRNQAASSSSNTEQLIVKSLGQKWDDRLIEAYGLFRASDPNAQLKQAEKWLDDYGKNEYLLLRSEERRVGKEFRSRWSSYH